MTCTRVQIFSIRVITNTWENPVPRAGHCPVLTFSPPKTSGYLKRQRKSVGHDQEQDYSNHIETNELSYHQEYMVLYTTDHRGKDKRR